MSINLHALRLFAGVVEHGGFSRAAAAMHISQPAVSRAVRELERQVGHPLLERGRPGARGRPTAVPGAGGNGDARGGTRQAGERGVRLTDAGVALLAHARAIVAHERAAEEELRGLGTLERGRLRIGASTTIATYLLPPLVARFHREHPGVALRVTSANTRDIVARLRALEIDVALVEGPVSEEGIEVTLWREDELVLIASPAHPLARRGRVPSGALGDELLIVREPGSGTRDVVSAALRRHGIRPARTLEVGSTEAIKQTVAAGLGVAIVSRAAAADQLRLGTLRVVALEGLVIRRALARLTLAGRPAGATARAFEALLAGERGP